MISSARKGVLLRAFLYAKQLQDIKKVRNGRTDETKEGSTNMKGGKKEVNLFFVRYRPLTQRKGPLKTMIYIKSV